MKQDDGDEDIPEIDEEAVKEINAILGLQPSKNDSSEVNLSNLVIEDSVPSTSKGVL